MSASAQSSSGGAPPAPRPPPRPPRPPAATSVSARQCADGTRWTEWPVHIAKCELAILSSACRLRIAGQKLKSPREAEADEAADEVQEAHRRNYFGRWPTSMSMGAIRPA